MSNGYIYVGPIYSQQFLNSTMMYALNSNYLPYAGYQMANIIEKENGSEESLSSALVFGSAFMGIPHVKKLVHPKTTINCIKDTNAIFKDIKNIEAFKNLPKELQGTAYADFFNMSWKGQKLNPALKDTLKTVSENYQAALKSGNPADIAKYSEEMKTILSEGKKRNWISRGYNKLLGRSAEKFKKTETVLKTAKEAGETAQKASIAAKTAAETAKTAGKTAQALNWTKNALKTGGFKGMAIFSGIIESFTEVLPAFSKGGSSEGVKQVAKSAVTVTADAAGWAIGAKAGASIGAAIGSIFPGAGTAIGGAIGGIIGGIAGAFCTRKVAKAVVGKSFSEKAAAKEKMAEKIAEQQQRNQLAQLQQQYPGYMDMPSEFSSNPFAQYSYVPFSQDYAPQISV